MNLTNYSPTHNLQEVSKKTSGRHKMLLVLVSAFIVLISSACTVSDSGTETPATTDAPVEEAEAPVESQPLPVADPSAEEESQAQKVEIEKMFHLADIANKSIEEVNAILGEPDIIEEGTWRYFGTDTAVENCPLAFYKNSAIEIKFIEGAAARITITPVNAIPFDENSPETQSLVLSLIGVDDAAPTDKKLQFIRWSGIQDIYEISSFNNELKGDGNDTVSYIYIITNEKYK